jgi:hypothetical protein
MITTRLEEKLARNPGFSGRGNDLVRRVNQNVRINEGARHRFRLG